MHKRPSMLTLSTISFFLLVAVVVGGCAIFVWHNTRAAVNVTNHWFELLQQGRFDDAYALTTPAFQNVCSAQALRSESERAGLTRTVSWYWSDREISVKEGWAVLAGGSDESSPVAVKLLRDSATWRVHSVVVSPLVGRQMRRFARIRADEPGLQVKVSAAESSAQN